MAQLDFVGGTDAPHDSAPPRPWSAKQTALAALLVAAGYYVGSRIGFALTFPPHAVSTLWPPNAILLGALLVAPAARWWIILLAALPVHLAVELSNGVPLLMVACWFISNCTQALIGAALTRRLLPRPIKLDTVHALTVFTAFGAFVAPLLASFLDAGFVTLNGWGEAGYWSVWRVRLFSNVLATLTIVPVILGLGPRTLRALRRMPRIKFVEGGSLAVSLLVVCIVSFVRPESVWRADAALLYAPLPLLLWAAVRFGAVEVSLGLAAVAAFATWGAVHGQGPFDALTPEVNALSIQIFLILISLPLAALAAVIAERRRAEESLRDSQRIAALTIGAARIGLWGMDLERNSITMDEPLRTLLDLTPEEATRLDKYASRVHPMDLERVMANKQAAISADAPRDDRGDSPVPEIEYRIVRPDGAVHWLLTRGTVLRREDGKAYRVTGTAVDITYRKHSEQAQREHDERLALAASAANIGFWSCELDTMRVWATEECRRLAGLSADAELTADFCRRLIHPEDMSRVEAAFGGTARAGSPVEMEIRIVLQDGDVRSVNLIGRLERDSTGTEVRMIGVAIDVTERRRAEREAGEQKRELAHLARVVTLGELSGALAHELGQPLAAIMSNAQAAARLMESETVDRAMVREILDDIVNDDRRAGNVIRRLRQLLKKDESLLEPLDPREMVQDALALAHSDLITHNIAVATTYDPDLPTVVGTSVITMSADRKSVV